MTDCVFIPERPYAAGVPSRVDITPVFAWDSGANSVDVRTGNVRCAFTMERAVGVVVGFTQDLTNVGNFLRMTHGFWFGQNILGQHIYRVLEGGAVRTAPLIYNDATVFDVRRIGSTVLYLVDGTKLYTSLAPSTGALYVGCSLYASGDRVL